MNNCKIHPKIAQFAKLVGDKILQNRALGWTISTALLERLNHCSQRNIYLSVIRSLFSRTPIQQNLKRFWCTKFLSKQQTKPVKENWNCDAHWNFLRKPPQVLRLNLRANLSCVCSKRKTRTSSFWWLLSLCHSICFLQTANAAGTTAWLGQGTHRGTRHTSRES